MILILTLTSSHCEGTGRGIEKLLVTGFNNVSTEFAILDIGELTKEEDYEVDQGWSWVVAEGSSIWVITEDWSMAIVGGSVSRWMVGVDGEGLVLEEKLMLGPGNTPTHLLVDKDDGHWSCLRANIGGGTWSVIEMAGDQLVKVSQTVSLDTEGCKEASKPHQTVVWGQFAYVVDMGCDVVWTFELGSGDINMVQRN